MRHLFEREEVAPLVSGITIAACAAASKAVLVNRDAHMRSISSDQLKQLDFGNNP